MINLNTIATTAHNLPKKASKAECFDLIKIMAERELSEHEKAKLYSFFLPPITTPKSLEQWVFTASAKKDIRQYLEQVMYSDGSRLVSTDGHRLHFISTDLPEGFYSQELEKLDHDWKFPEFDQIIPSSFEFSDPLDIKTLPIEINTNIDVYIIGGDLRIGIQVKYLKQAINTMQNPIIEYSNNTTCIRVTDDTGKTAIIIPVILENNNDE